MMTSAPAHSSPSASSPKAKSSCSAWSAQSAPNSRVRKISFNEAGRFIPLDQLAISPQCGFASTMEGNLLTEDQQWAKLRLVVDTAREVWG
jgi:hypothetical protein